MPDNSNSLLNRIITYLESNILSIEHTFGTESNNLEQAHVSFQTMKLNPIRIRNFDVFDIDWEI